MKGIRSSQAIVALFVMALGTTSALAAYDVGFTWNRYNDWVPGTTDGSSAGNPCKDSAGNPVWSAEYINNVPAGSDLGSANPWYTLPSSGLMVWDSHWGGGLWAQLYDYPPAIRRMYVVHITTDQAYRGDHHADVPLMRWNNPSATPLTVSLMSGASFFGSFDTGMPTGSVADLVIARTDASNGNSVHLVYSQTLTKTTSPTNNQWFALPALNIANLALDPGDDILFSIRSRTVTTGYNWLTVNFEDDVNITVVPEPATLALLAAGGLALLRRRRRQGSAFGSSSRPRIGRVVARRLVLLALACLGIMTAGTAEAQDYLYVCQSQANIVSKYTTFGGIVDETLITGLYIPTDLAFDKNGNLLVLENSNRRIGLYTTSGDTINTSFISTPFYPHNFALDGDGNIYVTGGGSFGAPSRIAKYTTSGTVVSHSFITTGLSSPAGIACDMNGNLFVANSGNGTIAKYTTSGALVNGALVSGLGYPVDLVYDGAGHLFLADQQRGVQEYTTSGELVAANLTPGFYGSCSIALDGRGNLFAGGENASYPVPIGQFTISGEVVNPALITGVRTPHGLVIGPIPEPATMALLGVGGLGLLRRRRR